MTESEVGGDLIHPEDIAVELPPDGPWRLANSDSEGVMLLRFGRKTDLSMRERHIAARHVGVLSKTRREELLMEQERAQTQLLEIFVTFFLVKITMYKNISCL